LSGGVAACPRSCQSASSEAAAPNKPAATPLLVDADALVPVQQWTDGSFSSKVPSGPAVASSPPLPATIAPAAARMAATMASRIFHQGSLKGRSPCGPAYVGDGTSSSVPDLRKMG
jgi:hypothetical protein